MKYRSLGNSGIIVSEIGFGAWGIGGITKGATSYGPTDDEQSKSALLCAFRQGINFYDTANVYGHSEELIGSVFRDLRGKVKIATKAGFREHLGPQDFSLKNLRNSLHESLRRLQTDYIDLFLLHDPPVYLKEITEAIGHLVQFKKEGKIIEFGISARSPNDGLVFAKEFDLPVLQVNFSLIDQRIIENGLFDLAQKKKIGLIGRTPLNFGFLTGKISGTDFEKSDHRSSWSKEQIKIWIESSNSFKEIIQKLGYSPVQLALSFCLSHPAISTVIPGMMKDEEVLENTEASNLPLVGTRELNKIYEIYKNCMFFLKK